MPIDEIQQFWHVTAFVANINLFIKSWVGGWVPEINRKMNLVKPKKQSPSPETIPWDETHYGMNEVHMPPPRPFPFPPLVLQF